MCTYNLGKRNYVDTSLFLQEILTLRLVRFHPRSELPYSLLFIAFCLSYLLKGVGGENVFGGNSVYLNSFDARVVHDTFCQNCSYLISPACQIPKKPLILYYSGLLALGVNSNTKAMLVCIHSQYKLSLNSK